MTGCDTQSTCPQFGLRFITVLPAFEGLGCEVVYFEGPRNEDEMHEFNMSVKTAFTMVAQVEKPGRVLLTAGECAELGYSMSLHGLTLLSASIRATEAVLQQLRSSSLPCPKERAASCLISTTCTQPWGSTNWLTLKESSPSQCLCLWSVAISEGFDSNCWGSSAMGNGYLMKNQTFRWKHWKHPLCPPLLEDGASRSVTRIF